MRRFAALALLLAVVSIAGCASGPTTNVLFVGNSYTYSNDLPKMVQDLARDGGSRISFDVRAPGGWWLRDHAASDETPGLIRDGGYDVVVLQEQSMITADWSLAQHDTRPAAVELALVAIEGGAEMELFMTWGHRDGSAAVGHSSYSSMQRAVADTYWRIGDAVGADVAPVGAAWWLARDERPDIALYQPDGSHPSEAGSYLAAAVLAASLFDVDLSEVDASLGLDEGTAAALRGFASRAVSGEVPWRG